MLGKCINSLKTIKWTDIFLFIIIILLFIIANALYNISIKMNAIWYSTDVIMSNTYSSLLLQQDNNQTDWNNEKIKDIQQKLDNLYKLSKNK